MFNFFFQFSPPVSWLAPYSEAEPTPSPSFRPRGRQSRWLTWWVGLGGLNEGISRDSSQLKEAFSGEVNGNSATPSCFPPLQWFLLFHGFLLRPAGHKDTQTDIQLHCSHAFNTDNLLTSRTWDLVFEEHVQLLLFFSTFHTLIWDLERNLFKCRCEYKLQIT